MLQHADPFLAEYVRSLLGDPMKYHQVYIDDSPITYVSHIQAPLLVLQGDNDARIPKEACGHLFALLKQNGKVVDVVYYPDEGHGFTKLEHQIDAAHRTVAWFDKYLKSSDVTTPASP